MSKDCVVLLALSFSIVLALHCSPKRRQSNYILIYSACIQWLQLRRSVVFQLHMQLYTVVLLYGWRSVYILVDEGLLLFFLMPVRLLVVEFANFTFLLICPSLQLLVLG